MKLNKLIIAVVLQCMLVPNAFSIECEIRSSSLDLRDGGIEFDPGVNVLLRSVNGGPANCIPKLLATGLTTPRSSIMSEVKNPNTALMYSETLNISELAAQSLPQGVMEIYRLRFLQPGNGYLELSVRVAPVAGPKGSISSTSYGLVGEIEVFDLNGAWIYGATAINQVVPTTDPEYAPRLVWRKIIDSMYGNKYQLDMNIGSQVIRLASYDPALPPNMYQRPFIPISRTYGNLGESNLPPTFNFKLQPNSTCEQPVGIVNGGKCF